MHMAKKSARSWLASPSRTNATSGGTSDARFIKDMANVAEFGLVGRTIHRSDECAALSDLETLTDIYRRVLAGYGASGGESPCRP